MPRSKKTMVRRQKYVGRLADKKVNTLVERRMTQIAKKEATKARAKSYKDYELGAFQNDGQTYLPSTSWVNITGNADGTLLECFQVPAADEDATISVVSRRTGDFIWVRGFNATGVIRMAGDSGHYAEVRIKLALLSQRRQVDPVTGQILADLPTPALYNDLNGSPMDEDQKEDYKGITVLAHKTITIRPGGQKVNINRRFKLSHYFKSPQRNHFAPSDLGGDNPLTRAYFFCAFADRDLSGVDFARPEIVCNVRQHYFQE